MSTKIKDWDKWWQLAKIKIKISGNKMNTLFYIESYHPIQPGSIDDTNILPNDNAIYGAHLCASAFLFMYLSPSLSLSFYVLEFSQFQFYPSLFVVFVDESFDDPKVIGDPTLFARSLLFSTLSLFLFGY